MSRHLKSNLCGYRSVHVMKFKPITEASKLNISHIFTRKKIDVSSVLNTQVTTKCVIPHIHILDQLFNAD